MSDEVKLGEYGGIDYAGRTVVNRDVKTGLRYGVISTHSLGEFWHESIEYVYFMGCPSCGTEFEEGVDPDEVEKCPACGHEPDFLPEAWYGDEPIGFVSTEEGYEVQSCLYSDLMVTKSPYWTWAQFCSPCVPGAGNLDNPTEPDCGCRCYCLGPEWFDDGKVPYPYWPVEESEEKAS